jgi:gamma-glutamyltranspeptidase/glutathione hydrolase
VTEVIAEDWALNRARWRNTRLRRNLHAQRPRAGQGRDLRNPLLANTLSAIAEGGRDAFYKGDIAQRIEKYMRAERRISHRRGPGRAPLRMGRAGVD